MASLSVVNDVINYNDLSVDSRPNNSSIYSLCRIDPVTKTGSFTVSDLYDIYVITAAATVTLPDASATSPNIGRVLHFRNRNATALVSASSNVIPQIGGSADTAIVSVANRAVTMVCTTSGWVIVRGVTAST